MRQVTRQSPSGDTDLVTTRLPLTKHIIAQAYARLHVLQREQGIGGHVAEVGVYQGRGFIPLCLLCGAQVCR